MMINDMDALTLSSLNPKPVMGLKCGTNFTNSGQQKSQDRMTLNGVPLLECKKKKHKNGKWACFCGVEEYSYMIDTHECWVWRTPCGEFRLIAACVLHDDGFTTYENMTTKEKTGATACWACLAYVKKRIRSKPEIQLVLQKGCVEPNPGPTWLRVFWRCAEYADFVELVDQTGLTYCPSCLYMSLFPYFRRDCPLCGECTVVFFHSLATDEPVCCYLQGLWYLESFPFTSYIQWLPKEVLEETLECVPNIAASVLLPRLWTKMRSAFLTYYDRHEIDGEEYLTSSEVNLQDSVWFHDLTEEGIEPNPGPRQPLSWYGFTLYKEKRLPSTSVLAFVRRRLTHYKQGMPHFCYKTLNDVPYLHEPVKDCPTMMDANQVFHYCIHLEKEGIEQEKKEEAMRIAALKELLPSSNTTVDANIHTDDTDDDAEDIESDLSLSIPTTTSAKEKHKEKGKLMKRQRKEKQQAKTKKKHKMEKHIESETRFHKLDSANEEERLKEVLAYRRSLLASCCRKFKKLLEMRDEIHFPFDGFAPSVETGFNDLWGRIDGTAWPTGPRLCLWGFCQVYENQDQSVTPIYAGGEDLPEKTGVKWGNTSADFIIGPLPYSNHVGFFYNELWLDQHYQYLIDNNYGPEWYQDDICCYRKGAAWRSKLPRFVVKAVERTAVFQKWWSVSDIPFVPLVVDVACPASVFKDGVSLHAGIMQTACRNMTSIGYTYCDYWKWVVNGTILYHSREHNNINLVSLSVFREEGVIRTALSAVLGVSHTADAVQGLFVTTQGLATRSHLVADALPLPAYADSDHPILEQEDTHILPDSRGAIKELTDITQHITQKIQNFLTPTNMEEPALLPAVAASTYIEEEIALHEDPPIPAAPATAAGRSPLVVTNDLVSEEDGVSPFLGQFFAEEETQEPEIEEYSISEYVLPTEAEYVVPPEVSVVGEQLLGYGALTLLDALDLLKLFPQQTEHHYAIWVARQDYPLRGHPVEEYGKSNAIMWNWQVHYSRERSSPFISQACAFFYTTAPDGTKVRQSIYEEPHHDSSRLQVEWTPGYYWDHLPYSGARPEVLYAVIFTELYLPHPDSTVFTCVARCGRSALPVSPLTEFKFDEYLRDVLIPVFKTDIPFRDEGMEFTSTENLLLTTANMPGPQRRRRLDWFYSYMLGMKNPDAHNLKFFVKADEVLYMHDPDPYMPEDTDPGAGKSRNIFNGHDTDFCFGQGSLMDAKNYMKEPEEPFFSFMSAKRDQIPMPRQWEIKLKCGKTVFFTYGADTDNQQDGLWYTRAREDTLSDHIHLIVGGDDNSFKMYYMGKLYEFECDVSGCDQSHLEHLAAAFCIFLQCFNLNPRVIDMIRNTYTANASFFHKNVLICLIKFLDSQLKTGVGHTSFANTIVVMSLIIYVIDALWLEHDLDERVWSLEDWRIGIQRVAASLGMELKVVAHDATDFPKMTFHKRYFVWSSLANMYVACPLPATTLVKMMKVRCPQLTKQKRFFEILYGGALSRRDSSHHPVIRIFVEKLASHAKYIYTENIYSSHTRIDSKWVSKVGDGDEKSHQQYLDYRYQEHAHVFNAGLLSFAREYDPTKFYDLRKEDWTPSFNKCWERDNQ